METTLPNPPAPAAIRWVHARYVNEGMEVLIPWDNKGTGLKVKVVVACGDCARVVNERRGIDVWRDLNDIYVPEGSQP